MLLKLRQDGRSKLQALSLDLPVVLISERRDLLRNFKHSFRVLLSDSAKHINGVDADIDSLGRETDQRVVKEHIKPLLIESGLALEQVSLAAIDKLVVSEVLFERLDDSNSHLHVVRAVSKNQLANLLTLIWTLLDQRAVASEKVFFKESVKLRCLSLL